MSTSLREQLSPLVTGTARACLKKIGYGTQDDANRALVNRVRQIREQLHTYRCPHCKKWHLTKLEQP